MFGVGLVGLSGSMIKDSVKEVAVGLVQSLAKLDDPAPMEDPEVTKVLLGKWIF
jgi:hypothetical protein